MALYDDGCVSINIVFIVSLLNKTVLWCVLQCLLQHQTLLSYCQTIRLICCVPLRCLVYSFCVTLDLCDLALVTGKTVVAVTECHSYAAILLGDHVHEFCPSCNYVSCF